MPFLRNVSRLAEIVSFQVMFFSWTPSLPAMYLATSTSKPSTVPSGFFSPMLGWSNFTPIVSFFWSLALSTTEPAFLAPQPVTPIVATASAATATPK